MTKLFTLILGLILLLACNPSREKQTSSVFNGLDYETIGSHLNNKNTHQLCECKGGVYLPTSFEEISFD